MTAGHPAFQREQQHDGQQQPRVSLRSGVAAGSAAWRGLVPGIAEAWQRRRLQSQQQRAWQLWIAQRSVA